MKRILILIMILFIFSACENKEETSPMSMEELNIDPEFQFNTTKLVELNINSQDTAGNNLANIPFSIFKRNPQTDAGSRVLRSATNAEGNFQSTIKLPSYYNKIYIRPAAAEVHEFDISHISNERAEINANFTYTPNKGRYNKNLDRFEPVTASDGGFDFTLQNIVSDYENNTATMTISITNNTNKKFSDAYFTIPTSVQSSEIEPNSLNSNTHYESPAGMSYWVEYPVNHWIMGNSIAYYGQNGFSNGETDYYYVTLPIGAFESWNTIQMYARATGNTSGLVTLGFSYIPECSLTEYYPAENEFGTLAYEDYWPTKGDYDMNDLVLDYNMSCEKTFTGELEMLVAKFKIRAIGASFDIGFGFQLPDFIEVNGTISSTTNLAYVETDNRTIIVFDNARDIVTENTDQFINTDPALPYTETSVMTVSIPVESTGDSADEVWYLPPYNPFIFVNDRTKEIHLANYSPTEMADVSLFNTQDDASDPGSGFYYRTSENLPWAFHIAESSPYPIEKTEIIQAFPNFSQWAESAGTEATDWYDFSADGLTYPEP